MKKYTIKTSYSTEVYYCFDIYDFLTEICFCDEYEVISEDTAEIEKIQLYNNIIQKLKDRGIEINAYWTSNVLLYLVGYYETLDEVLNI